MKKYLVLFCSFFFLFCVNKEKDIHTKGIEIISQVFSDSVSNKNFYFKDCELSKKNFILSENLYTEDSKGNFIKTSSQLEYFCKILNEKDSTYIKEQMVSNINKSINKLEAYNFNISNINIKTVSSKCRISISLPIFNKSFDKFYIIIEEGSSFGEYIFNKNEDNMWVLKKRISLTING